MVHQHLIILNWRQAVSRHVHVWMCLNKQTLKEPGSLLCSRVTQTKWYRKCQYWECLFTQPLTCMLYGTIFNCTAWF